MTTMKYRIVAVALIECGEEILLGKKSPNVGPYPNTWVLPGGGVNLDSETVPQALIREIHEETGMTVTEQNLEFLEMREDNEPDKHGEMTHYLFLTYKVTIENKTVIPGDDVKQLTWVKKKDLKTLSLARPSISLFTKLGWLQ